MTEAERDTSKRAVRAREVEMIGSEERMVIAIALAVVSIKRARGGNHTQAVAEMQEAVGSRASRLVEAFNTLVDVLDGSEKHDVAMMSLTVEYMGAGSTVDEGASQRPKATTTAFNRENIQRN